MVFSKNMFVADEVKEAVTAIVTVPPSYMEISVVRRLRAYRLHGTCESSTKRRHWLRKGTNGETLLVDLC